MASLPPVRGPKNLIAMTDGTAIERFLPRAMAFAQASGAHLSILLAAPVPIAGRYAPNVDPEQLHAVAAAVEQAATGRLAEIDKVIAAAGDAVDAHLLAEEPERLLWRLVTEARHADLVLAPGDHACGNSDLRDRLIGAILDQAGCPVMIVRDRAAVWPAGRVVLAWNGSRASSRAWRDARELIHPGARIDIATGGYAVTGTHSTGLALSALVERHVRQGGFDPHVHEIAIHPMHEEWRSPTDRLIEFEQQAKPDLMVMGAGIEALDLGPLTRAMMKNGQAALLLSR